MRPRKTKPAFTEFPAGDAAPGPHRLYVGDCLSILPQLPDQSVDVVVTSPPYNLDLAYRSYHDRRSETDYLDWMMCVATEIRRVLRADGSFFLNIAGSSSQPWLPFELIVRLRALFVLQNHLSWVKSIATGQDSIGHYKPVQGQRFLHRNHEHIFHLTHDGQVKLDRLSVGVPYKDKSNIARRGHARDLRCRGDTWFIPYKTVRTRAGKFHHPGTFPVDLPRWCIRLHGKPGAVVLDPFAGTGTTLVATALEGGQGIGVEMDKDYAATAHERLTELATTPQDHPPESAPVADMPAMDAPVARKARTAKTAVGKSTPAKARKAKTRSVRAKSPKRAKGATRAADQSDE